MKFDLQTYQSASVATASWSIIGALPYGAIGRHPVRPGCVQQRVHVEPGRAQPAIERHGRPEPDGIG
jgi:hypothetical protein